MSAAPKARPYKLGFELQLGTEDFFLFLCGISLAQKENPYEVVSVTTMLAKTLYKMSLHTVRH